MSAPILPADLYQHSLRPCSAFGRLVKTDAPIDMTYRDYWNPLAVLKPGTDFTGSSR
jgi:hypothetical protein